MGGPEITDTGYIVHRRRLRETSLLLQIFTAGHGRLGVVARGAAAPRKGARSWLEFTPYALAWSGRGDLPQLRRAEPEGRTLRLEGERLFSALYMNELIVKLIQRGEGDALAFKAYVTSLQHLAEEHPIEPVLRHFEALLLDACGYGLELAVDGESGAPLKEDRLYHYVPERGAVARSPSVPSRPVSGATLQALAGHLPWDAERLREAKGLMRFVLDHHLGGQTLAARALFGLPLNDASGSASTE